MCWAIQKYRKLLTLIVCWMLSAGAVEAQPDSIPHLPARVLADSNALENLLLELLDSVDAAPEQSASLAREAIAHARSQGLERLQAMAYDLQARAQKRAGSHQHAHQYYRYTQTATQFAHQHAQSFK